MKRKWPNIAEMTAYHREDACFNMSNSIPPQFIDVPFTKPWKRAYIDGKECRKQKQCHQSTKQQIKHWAILIPLTNHRWKVLEYVSKGLFYYFNQEKPNMVQFSTCSCRGDLVIWRVPHVSFLCNVLYIIACPLSWSHCIVSPPIYYADYLIGINLFF